MRSAVLLAIILLGASGAEAANRYVRAGASGSGNGSDWTNAFASLPSTLVRGDTYYLAAGSYGSYAFDDAVSGTTLITIKKATVADHGTDAGWSNDYGTGTASFSGWTFSTSYWEVDGQTGGGPGSWNAGHGFSLYSTANILITFAGSVNNIAIRHTKADSNRGSSFIAGLKGTTGSCSKITISYCQFSNIFGPIFHISNWSDSIIEYSYLYYNLSTPAWHSEGISSIGTNSNITIRYNLWDRIDGTAVLAGVNVGSSNGWNIYGNVFSRSVTTIYYYWEAGSNKNSMSNSHFYNNIVVGMSGQSVGGIAIQSGSGNSIYNNIWYKNDANSFVLNGTHDYNYASDNIRTEGCSPSCDKDAELLSGESYGQNTTGSPFVSYNADPLLSNFQLKTSTNAGIILASPYNADMAGNARGSDGIWDRGSYEYVIGGGSAQTIPSPPTGLWIQ